MKKLKYVLISLDYHSLYFSKQRGERNIWSYYGNGIKYPNENYFKANLSPLIFGYSPLISYSLIKKDLKSRWNRKKFSNYINFDTEAGGVWEYWDDEANEKGAPKFIFFKHGLKEVKY